MDEEIERCLSLKKTMPVYKIPMNKTPFKIKYIAQRSPSEVWVFWNCDRLPLQSGVIMRPDHSSTSFQVARHKVWHRDFEYLSTAVTARDQFVVLEYDESGFRCDMFDFRTRRWMVIPFNQNISGFRYWLWVRDMGEHVNVFGFRHGAMISAPHTLPGCRFVCGRLCKNIEDASSFVVDLEYVFGLEGGITCMDAVFVREYVLVAYTTTTRQVFLRVVGPKMVGVRVSTDITDTSGVKLVRVTADNIMVETSGSRVHFFGVNPVGSELTFSMKQGRYFVRNTGEYFEMRKRTFVLDGCLVNARVLWHSMKDWRLVLKVTRLVEPERMTYDWGGCFEVEKERGDAAFRDRENKDLCFHMEERVAELVRWKRVVGVDMDGVATASGAALPTAALPTAAASPPAVAAKAAPATIRLLMEGVVKPGVVRMVYHERPPPSLARPDRVRTAPKRMRVSLDGSKGYGEK